MHICSMNKNKCQFFFSKQKKVRGAEKIRGILQIAEFVKKLQGSETKP